MAKPNLSVGSFGEEVAKLHTALVQSGVDVPASEVNRQFFGPGTRQAVQQLQQTKGLSVTGDVDTATHAILGIGTQQAVTSVGPPQESGLGSKTGVIGGLPPIIPRVSQPLARIVRGVVRDARGNVLSGVPVMA